MTMAIKNITSLLAVILLILCSSISWSEEQITTETVTVENQLDDTSNNAVEQEVVDTASMLKDDHPESYQVIKGDTLWDISNRFLKNPWMWPEIWHVNPQIANPHLIYPGDTVKLVYLEGGPRLTVKRGEAGMTYKLSPDDKMKKVGGTATADNRVGKDGKLEPRVRALPLDEPIPAIPLDIIDPFLTGTRIVQEGVFEGAPYVVQGSQKHVISGVGSELYARGDFKEESSVYGFFRKGKVYIDPETKEFLGIEAKDIGTGKMKSKEGDIARLTVVRSTQEIRTGDRLLTNQERRVDSTFFPSAPHNEINGSIIDVDGGVSQIGAMSVVLINKGEREGLQSGNILAIYQRGELVRDDLANEKIRLPDERAGLLMIFAPFEKLSYALVLYADRPLAVGDMVRKP